ncbi:type II secretion system protein [Candidatus Sumerlaeota bacterium]|nr:type II secretion system protein [Candidatus Sumerlaeota bacterium]
MKRNQNKGFTLIESLIAAVIATLSIISILFLLGFLRTHNELEQERNRAFQIVTQALDLEAYKLFSYTESRSVQTIWDKGTPTDASDDTIGYLEVIVRDPKTGAILTSPPAPAVLVEIEATMSWIHRGPRLGRREMRETAMTYKVP